MTPFYRACRALFQALLLILFRGRVIASSRVPRRGPVLLVSNHQSYLDPPLAGLALMRSCHFMARDTLFRNPRFTKAIQALNAFPVKRGAADIGAIKESLRRLRDGALLVVFPEGTRTEDGRIRPLQPGVILLARKTKAPIVPTLILGAFEAWPRDSRTPRPRPILVAYDHPISVKQLAALSDQQCVDLVRERIAALMERYRHHVNVAGWLRPLPDGKLTRDEPFIAESEAERAQPAAAQ